MTPSQGKTVREEVGVTALTLTPVSTDEGKDKNNYISLMSDT